MASLLSLPSDLLVFLLDFIAVRPRLLIVSCVCRRFREVVLLSIHTLPDEHRLYPCTETTPANYSRFPNLKSILFTSEVHTRILESSHLSRVRSLRVRTLRHTAVPLPFSSLTSLHYRPTFQTPAHLIAQNATSLTELQFQPEEYMEDLDVVQKLDLPQLRSLSVLTFSAQVIFAPLLSSLTQLSFSPLGRALDNLRPAPHLRTLHVSIVDSRLEPLVSWILSLPSLTSLSIITSSFPDELWFLLESARTLTGLTIMRAPSDVSRLRQCLAANLNFHRLSSAFAPLSPDALTPECWARLTFVSTHQISDTNLEKLLQSCPNLETFKVLFLSISKAAPRFTSTSLRRLSLAITPDGIYCNTLVLQLALLALLLRGFPMLTALRQNITVDAEETDLPAADAALEDFPPSDIFESTWRFPCGLTPG